VVFQRRAGLFEIETKGLVCGLECERLLVLLKTVSDLVQTPVSAPTATLFGGPSAAGFGGQFSVNGQFARGLVS
jgi:hypothetical protein